MAHILFFFLTGNCLFHNTKWLEIIKLAFLTYLDEQTFEALPADKSAMM